MLGPPWIDYLISIHGRCVTQQERVLAQAHVGSNFFLISKTQYIKYLNKIEGKLKR